MESLQNILRLYTCLKYTFSTVFIISLGPFIPFSPFQSYEVNKKKHTDFSELYYIFASQAKGGLGGEAPQEKFWGLGLNPPLIVGLKGGIPGGGSAPPWFFQGGGPTPPAPTLSPPMSAIYLFSMVHGRTKGGGAGGGGPPPWDSTLQTHN